MKKLLFFLLFPLLITFAQISISAGGNVSENFNSMGISASATLPANWRVDKNTSVKTVGSYSSALIATERRGGINENSSMANGIYNFGLGDASTAIDRAVGGQSSSSSSKSVNVYASFKNTGTATISQVDISYDVMRFRNGLNTSGFSIQLYYSTDGATWVSAVSNFLSSFTGPNADNNGAAIVPMETKQILNQTLAGLSIVQNGSFYLAWNYSVTSGTTTSNAQALGIDNFVMNNILSGGVVTAPNAPVAVSATNVSKTGFRANWNSSSGATNYFIDVSTNPGFTGFVPGFENKNAGNAVSFDVTGLNSNTTYYYRVRASNSVGASVSSNNISATTLSIITYVQFSGISDAVIKSAGTYSLVLSITDPDPASATTCSVTFVADSSTATAALLNNFSTQTVTFPAGSSANQQIIFTIPDIGGVEPAKKAFLQIQNVSGGASAQPGTISKFRLSITSGVDNAYYSTVSAGLTGAALKNALHNLIKNHTKYPYTDNGIDVWKMLKAADEDPKNPSNIVGIYSGLSIPKDPQTFWNREHVWSKSHGNFGTDIGAGTDAHHLRPENPTVNSRKSNLDFDNGGTPYSLSPNNKVATVTVNGITTDISWEPRNEVKGDVARMVFYMATRYTGDPGEPNLQIIESIPSSPNNEPYYSKLSTLLAWNQQDPPDAFEMNRNNVIYFYQHNRNPYIDHPEWVSAIWGTTDIGNNYENSSITDYTLYQNYPNPFNPETVISYQLASNSYITLKVYDILGREVATLVNEFQQAGIYHSTFSSLHSSLTSGVYIYTINAKSLSGGKEFRKSAKLVLIK